MSRGYSIEFENITIGTADGDWDLFEIKAGAPVNKPVELVGLVLVVISELGDYEEEWMNITVLRGIIASGGGVTSLTAVKLDEFDAASIVNNPSQGSTVLAYSSSTKLYTRGWNVRQRFEQWWPRGSGPRTHDPGEQCLTVLLNNSVNDALSMTGTAYFIEGIDR